MRISSAFSEPHELFGNLLFHFILYYYLQLKLNACHRSISNASAVLSDGINYVNYIEVVFPLVAFWDYIVHAILLYVYFSGLQHP